MDVPQKTWYTGPITALSVQKLKHSVGHLMGGLENPLASLIYPEEKDKQDVAHLPATVAGFKSKASPAAP